MAAKKPKTARRNKSQNGRQQAAESIRIRRGQQIAKDRQEALRVVRFLSL
jgi:hypothetical protein